MMAHVNCGPTITPSTAIAFARARDSDSFDVFISRRERLGPDLPCDRYPFFPRSGGVGAVQICRLVFVGNEPV